MPVGFLVDKRREKRQLERHRHVWVSSINRDLKENGQGVDWVLGAGQAPVAFSEHGTE